MILDDDSIINFGPYKGRKLINIPAEYLLGIYNNKISDKDLLEYIKDNLDVLKFECKKNGKKCDDIAKNRVVKKIEEVDGDEEEEYFDYDEVEEEVFDEIEDNQDEN